MDFTFSFTGGVRELHSLQGNQKVGFKLSSLAVCGPGQIGVFVCEAGLGPGQIGVSVYEAGLGPGQLGVFV